MNYADGDLKFDLLGLLDLFGDPMDLSNPERLDYWFEYERADGVKVLLSFSGYMRSVAVIVRHSETVAHTARLERCDAIKILDPERRILEAVSSHHDSRCLISLDGETVLDVKVGSAD